MKVSEELKAKIAAELDRRMEEQGKAPHPLTEEYWGKHDCKDYDNGNGVCAWCGKAVAPEKIKTEVEYKQKTFTREEIALAIKSALASLYEDCANYPNDPLWREKELRHETVTLALINLGFWLDLDDLICDEDGDVLLYPSKDNKRID